MKFFLYSFLFFILTSSAVYIVVFSENNDAPNYSSEYEKMRNFWIKEIKESGAEKSYKQFKLTANNYDIDLHTNAHLFGEALYETEGLAGVIVCDESFDYGCFHSFFGLAVHDYGPSSLGVFDQACKDKYGSNNLPCQHGIGHGALAYTGYDQLEEALALCEKISDRPTGGCSSGVFMEYNFHSMDSEKEGAFIRELKDNPYEPCDTLPNVSKPSCYYEQVQWWMSIYNNDWKEMSDLCSSLEGDRASYEACYNGIGHYLSFSSDYNFAYIVSTCSLMSSQTARGLCHEGASWQMISRPESVEEARELCELLESPQRQNCLNKLGIQ